LQVDQEALSESLASSLACFEVLKPTVAQLFVRSCFSGFSLVRIDEDEYRAQEAS
jgi:hypothetical protein